MAAVVYNIAIEAGASFGVTFTRTDAEGNPLAYDEGAEAFFQVRTTERAAGDPLVQTKPEIDGATVVLALAPEQTRALDVSGTTTFKYAIEIHYAGAVERLVQGNAVVSPELVRNEAVG